MDITSVLSQVQTESLRKTCLDYSVAYAIFSEEICSHQTANYNNVYGFAYEKVKNAVPELPTAIVSACGRNACANVKAFNANVSEYNKNRKRHNDRVASHPEKYGNTFKPMLQKWEFHGRHNGKSVKLNTAAISLLQEETVVSLASDDMRIRIPYKLPKWFRDKYPSRKLYSGQVTFKDNSVFLYVTYALVNEEPVREIDESTVIGVDRGIYHPIATSTGVLVSSKPSYAVTRKYAHNVSTLKQKRTSSARRRLRSTAGKIRRHSNDVNHCISKFLATQPNVSCYVFEDLTHISSGKRHGSRKENRWIHSWSFRDLEEKIRYKCELAGISIEQVKPDYTSQRCSSCGNIAKESRHGNRYFCVECGHVEHADINAAKNIRERYLANLCSSHRVHSTTRNASKSRVAN